jgi:hypothetical protein
LKPINRIGTAPFACAVGVALSLAACSGPDAGSRLGSDSVTRSPLRRADPSAAEALDVTVRASVDDACPGAGSGRVLVRLAEGSTCASLVGALSSAVSDVSAAYQFADAPDAVRERYCVYESNAQGIAAVPSILAVLQSGDSVDQAMHDCSTDPLVPSPSVPGAFVAPAGAALSSPAPASSRRRTEDKSTAQEEGTHSCDTCAIACGNTLFVNVPINMTPVGDSTMVVRFLDSSVADHTILAPGGAQSFVVPDIGVDDDSQVRVFAPGETPPPK